MTLAIVNAILLLGAILSIALYLAVEARPQWRLSRWVRRRILSPPKTLSKLNQRQILDVEEFALIERNIPKLKSVVVISNFIQNPTRELAFAVMDNFQDGAKYSFFVSKSGNAPQDLSDRKSWFKHIYEVAKGTAPAEGEKAVIHSHSFEDLFAIHRLPTDWVHVPYVFYTFENGGGRLSTVTLKGTTAGVGISAEYLRVAPSEAKAIIDLCTMASVFFGGEVADDTQLANTLPKADVSRASVIEFPGQALTREDNSSQTKGRVLQ